MVNAIVLAATLRFFGSAGAEAQLTPANTASPLNPDNVLALPYQTNGADATLFAQAAPDDKRWKARVKVRADASDRGADRVQLGEALVQFRVTPWLDVSAGRMIEKWGTGYGWTPTAFIGPAKDPTDPNDRRSAYRGRDMLRADVFVKETTFSFYKLSGDELAARAYRLIGGTDVSLYVHSDAQGVSLSRVFGDALELHGEVAHQGDDVRAVAGGQYTFRNDTNVVLEIYHGTDGLTSREWDAFRDSVDDDLFRANRTYAPLRMARTYAFARVFRSFEKTSAELIAIANLRDASAIVRASLTYKLRPNVSVYAIHTEFTGAARSELAYLQVARVTTVGARVYF